MPVGGILSASGGDSKCQWEGFQVPEGGILSVSGRDSKCQRGGF